MEQRVNKLKERVISNLIKRRDNVINGNINCIPFPFPNFRNDIPGIEQAKYYQITGATKSAKSQFASYLFIYHSLLYAYRNPEQLSVKIFYYPLEETPENVMERFISYLLYTLSNKKYRISPSDLRSTNNDNPLPAEIIDILHSDEYREILDFFEDHIIFSDSTNPTGIFYECKRYAEEHGTVHTTKVTVKDDFGEKKLVDKFDYYEMENPQEYRIIFVDHISLISQERGMSQRETMGKLSEYMVLLRNRYKFTPVIIHQQALFENIDAFKMDKLTPSIANLADNKAIARDVNVCISLFSPFKYGIKQWMNYDITKLRDNVRFIEVLLNRDGQSNGVMALYFDGAVNAFAQLPSFNDIPNMNKVYALIQANKPKRTSIAFFALSMKNKVKSLFINRKFK